jgi:CHAT domain-containing protein
MLRLRSLLASLAVLGLAAEPAGAQPLKIDLEKTYLFQEPEARALYFRAERALAASRFREAEALAHDALVRMEPFDDGRSQGAAVRVAASLQLLGRIVAEQGRNGEALALAQRAERVITRVSGERSFDTARAKRHLADAFARLGRHAEAEAAQRSALAIFRGGFGASSGAIAGATIELAHAVRAQGRRAEAGALLAEVAANFNERDPEMVQVRIALGLDRLEQGAGDEALGLLRQALALARGHPEDAAGVAYAEWHLAGALHMLGRPAEALPHARAATAFFRDTLAGAEPGYLPAPFRDEDERRVQFLAHLESLARTLGAAGMERAALIAEGFELAQLVRLRSTAAALAGMAARFAATSGELARLARERQDLAEQRALSGRRLIASLGQGSGGLEQLRAESARLEQQLAVVDRELASRFPEFEELINPRPLALADARALLRENEAMLSYLVYRGTLYLWAVRRDAAEMIAVNTARDGLESRVKRLREHLDPTGAQGLRNLVRPFPAEDAHQLYRLLVAPAEALLRGADHLIVVADGPLQSLPFGVLLTEPPGAPLQGFDAYPGAAWLARRFAITTLPAEGSLRALRRFARQSAARQPFAGFGDPVLGGAQGAARAATRGGLFGRGTVANVAEVRKLARLPETADELRAIGRLLRSEDAIHVGARATEAAVKRAGLSGYRVIAFATHGLMAGELGDASDAALVLTPPEQGTPEDDGLLTAGEVAQLELDADWVILSACNTAAPDGSPAAEGFSGLARAFFYAGARALLVSHWAVASDATVALTTRMFEESAKGAGRAEALRRSMLAMMQSRDKPHFAHPMFWAPFVVVGEGG